MRFLIAGSSGFLGTHLSRRLRTDGHDVTALVRRPAGPGESTWDPYAGRLDADAIEAADVVVNLAGSPTVGNPQSQKWADDLRRSRVTTTAVLADAIAASDRKPAFLAGNAIAYFGDRDDEVLTDDSTGRRSSLLAGVTHEWQEATDPAAAAGARVTILRTSPVIDRRGAPLKQLRLLYLAGLGGRLGSGEQYMPVITLRDWVGAVAFLAGSEVSGPVNLCLPEPGTNADFTRELARQVRRPAFLTVPAIVLEKAAGPMAPDLLGSVRAVPQKLVDSGFEFADKDMAHCVAQGLNPQA